MISFHSLIVVRFIHFAFYCFLSVWISNNPVKYIRRHWLALLISQFAINFTALNKRAYLWWILILILIATLIVFQNLVLVWWLLSNLLCISRVRWNGRWRFGFLIILRDIGLILNYEFRTLWKRWVTISAYISSLLTLMIPLYSI